MSYNVDRSNTGGGRGIRTPERVTPLTVFKTAGFNHSPIPPISILPDFIRLRALSLPGPAWFRQDCHYLGTTSNGLNCARLGLSVRARVAHLDDDIECPSCSFTATILHSSIVRLIIRMPDSAS